MSGAIPPLSQYAFMVWCSVQAQGQLYLYFYTLITDYHFPGTESFVGTGKESPRLP
jgi:hypothetical protein